MQYNIINVFQEEVNVGHIYVCMCVGVNRQGGVHAVTSLAHFNSWPCNHHKSLAGWSQTQTEA